MADNKTMITLLVSGMSCPSCVRHVEVALSKVPGVEKAVVDLAAGKARVSYNSFIAKPDELIKAVEQAGYAASTEAAD
ncbi:metal transporting ATPase [Dehalogenimonas sp. WBC-2]|nr:metal transporting ATPase [Dehalogenimonas sp. WBC-2]